MPAPMSAVAGMGIRLVIAGEYQLPACWRPYPAGIPSLPAQPDLPVEPGRGKVELLDGAGCPSRIKITLVGHFGPKACKTHEVQGC